MNTQKVMVAAFATLVTAALAQAQTVTPAAISAPAATAARSSAHSGKKTTTKAPLDLHAPELNRIYSSQELRYIMAPDDTDSDSLTAVSVKGTRTVQVPGQPGNQLIAVPWAIMHPTQAWRIFTPLEQP